MSKRDRVRSPRDGSAPNSSADDSCESCDDPCPEDVIGPQDRALRDCILSMCEDDPDVVAGARNLTIISRNQKRMNRYRFDGTKWRHDGIFHSGGSARGTTIWINRGNPCENTKEVVYHEVWHTTQPASMNSRDKEIDAYYNTELWSIQRGARGRPNLRTVDADGNPVPDRAAIEAFVDRAYGYAAGRERIVRRRGNEVLTVPSRRWRPAQAGDVIREVIEEERCERPLDTSTLVCP